MNVSDLQDAFIFVGGAAPCARTAMVNPRTGEVRLHSEMGDFDEIPDEVFDSDEWLEIPHKNELENRSLDEAIVAWCGRVGLELTS